MKEFFGYGRTRSRCDKGAIVKRHFNDYVNCIHTLVGGGWKTMEVLVAEFDMSEIKYIGQMSSSQNSRVIDSEGISYAVTNGHKDGEPKIKERDTPMKGNYTEPRICTMVGCDPNNPSSRARSDHYEQFLEMGDDVSNTLTSVQKDNLVAEPNVLTPKRTDFGKQGYIEVPQGAVFDMSYPESTTRRGRVQEGGQVSPTLMAGGEAPCYYEGKAPNPDECLLVGGSWDGWQDDRVFDDRGSSPTLDTNSEKRPRIQGAATSYRIRKLTPRECFRLMGVTEADIDKIQQSGVSQSQQYKMAGNSIVVDCLYHMFRKMFTETACESQQLSLV